MQSITTHGPGREDGVRQGDDRHLLLDVDVHRAHLRARDGGAVVHQVQGVRLKSATLSPAPDYYLPFLYRNFICCVLQASRCCCGRKPCRVPRPAAGVEEQRRAYRYFSCWAKGGKHFRTAESRGRWVTRPCQTFGRRSYDVCSALSCFATCLFHLNERGLGQKKTRTPCRRPPALQGARRQRL